MKRIFVPVLRHILAATIGAVAGWVTTKTGVILGPDVIDPVVAAATIGVYGAANHIIKDKKPETR